MLAVKLRIGNGMVGVYTLMLALKSGEAISITIYSLKERIIRSIHLLKSQLQQPLLLLNQ